MSRFLLEVLTEEIPANALSGVRSQLADGFRTGLDGAGFDGVEMCSLSTARRLIVLIDGLSRRQPDRSERLTGPPVGVAFDDDGRPTRAAEGFARKAGVDVVDLERETTPKGEYIAATRHVPGRPTADLLAEIAVSVVPKLRFPKMMRWGSGEHVFGRPVHGVLALLDGDGVSVELFGLEPGGTTVGHRVVAPGAVEVPSAGAYADLMREHGVVVDPGERRERLQAEARRLAGEVDCRIHDDPELVAEHVELVEHPALVRGRIEERFLELPPEVVVTTLRHHQKCLILESEDGRLAPYFLAVIDRPDDPEGLIRQGNEWVIGARLADAAFFFAEDRKRSLRQLVPELDRIEYHRKLGSVGDKADRVGRLAVKIADAAGLDVDRDEIHRVAPLVKADLPTNMVGEFPDLQGVMGGHYLRLEGEPDAVWTAARDHYGPHGLDGVLPSSELGCVLAAADRLDTLAGLFGLGVMPSGSRDPFGLRRAAQSLVRLLAGAGWGIDIRPLVEAAAELCENAASEPTEAAVQAVVDFIGERVRRYLVDVEGVAGDTADAVMGAGWTPVPLAARRARELERVRAADEFRSLALAFKRVRNITADQPDAGLDAELLREAAERDLHAAWIEFHETLDRTIPAHRFTEAFDAMAEIAEVLDRFFIEVLVMDENEKLRDNRIALLKVLGRDFLRLADLSRLQVEGG